jgi:uncharacterized membrane protein
MNGTLMVALAALSFVGSHLLLSHPLRVPLVKALKPGGFMALYALVAFATLGWLGHAYKAAPDRPLFWTPGDGLWAAGTAIMLVASILLMGSLIRNPALPGPAGPLPDRARGVYAITRHPMLWAVALWGVTHILVYPEPSNIVIAATMIVFALAGAAAQDRKKEALDPGRWRQWESMTSWWPFAAIAQGRARFGGFRPHDIAGGIVIWLGATWLHIPASGWAAGLWRWIV